MNAIILSVGDELVLGQTVDTNSAWLSQQLTAVGIDIAAHHTVGDSQAEIAAFIGEAIKQTDTLIISGGLGPTDDDLTRQALSDALNAPLELDASWLVQMQTYFSKLNRVMPEKNKVQAMIPRGARMIWNHAGTAAGIEAVTEHRFDRTRPSRAVRIFVVPGVPKEMKAMFTGDILPKLREFGGGAAILQTTLHTFGVGESTVAERLGDLMTRGRNPSVGTTVSGGVVSLRVNSRFDSPAVASTAMEQTVAACERALGDMIYGRDAKSLPGVVGDMLAAGGLSITTAESCSGGLLAKYLTDAAGSSRFFRGGWVAYANEFKSANLGMSAELIAGHGAVSEPVARAMADGARRAAGTDLAVSITGVAGPDGGSDAKPVGTVCIALAHAGGTLVRTFNFPGDREMIRDRSAKMALTLVRYHIIKKPLPLLCRAAAGGCSNSRSVSFQST